MSEPLPKFDRVVSLKVTAAQGRRLKAAARKAGKRFGVWARERLLESADRIMTGANGTSSRHLEAPVLPGARGG